MSKIGIPAEKPKKSIVITLGCRNADNVLGSARAILPELLSNGDFNSLVMGEEFTSRRQSNG